MKKWLDRYDKGGPVKKLNASEIEDVKKFAADVNKNPQKYLANKNTKGERKVLISPGINTVNTPGVNYNTLQNAAVNNTFDQQQNAFNTFWHSPEGQAYQYNLAIQNDELEKKQARKEAIENGATFREVPQFGFNNQVVPSDPQMGIPIPDATATGLADPLNWPLYLATGRGIASGLGAAGEAFLPHLAKVAPYFEAPLTFGETVIPGVTPGSLTAGYFAHEGYKKLPQTQASVLKAYNNPTGQNILNAATDVGWNTMDFLGTGEAVKGAEELTNFAINKGENLATKIGNIKIGNAKISDYAELAKYKASAFGDKLSETKGVFSDLYNLKKLDNEWEAAKIKKGDGWRNHAGLGDQVYHLGNEIRKEEYEIYAKLKQAQDKLQSTNLNTLEKKDILIQLRNLDDRLAYIKRVKKEYKIGDKNTLIKNEMGPLAEATNYGEGTILDFNTLEHVPVYVKPSGNTNIIKKSGKDINIESLNYDLPQVSENLPIVNKSNIQFIENAAPGSVVFGSSRGVADAELAHLSGDYDALISRDNYDKFIKDKYPFLKENGPAIQHDILHGKGIQGEGIKQINHGAVDFVVVEKNAAGKATGRRAQELYRQFDPEGYYNSVKEFMEKYKHADNISSEEFENGLNIPYTPDELLSKVNPEIKTILDSYEINVGNPSKVKHTNRIDAYINYGNPNIVIQAQEMFIKSLVGTKGNIGHQFNINSFDNLEKNLEVLDKINFAGDVKAVASNPKRMQAALNDYYIHQTTLSRGVNSHHPITGKKLTLEEIDASFKEWDPEAGGGQAMGAGMNHVSLGKSGDYTYYGHKQIGLNNLDTSDPLKYVESIKHKTNGKLPFTDEEKNLLKDILVKHGLNDMVNYPINNSNDLIRILSYENNVNKNILNEFSKATGKKIAITDEYGESKYASTLQDFDKTMDALSYAFSQHTVKPKSKFQRDSNMQNKLGSANIARTIEDFYKHMNAAETELETLLKKQTMLKNQLNKVNDNLSSVEKISKKIYEKRYPGKKENLDKLEKELLDLNIKIGSIQDRAYRARTLKKDIIKYGGLSALTGVTGATLYGLYKLDKKNKEEIKNYQELLKQQIKEKKSPSFVNIKKEEGGDVTDYDFAAWQLADPIRASYHVVNPEDFHGPDKYKYPNHMTFSDESIYSTPEHMGGHWTELKNGKWQFQPSQWNIQNAGGKKEFLNWWNQGEGKEGNKVKFGSGGEHGGLDRWFAEKWVDIKTGKQCGRQEGEKRRGYPACRPSKRVSSETPKTASELSSSEKEKFKRNKTSSKRISYQHRRMEDGGQIHNWREVEVPHTKNQLSGWLDNL